MRWAWHVRVRRHGRWVDAWDWRGARFGRSICGTWSDGPRGGGTRRCGTWGSMNCTGAKEGEHQQNDDYAMGMGLHVCTYQNINSREAASVCPAGFRIGEAGLAVLGFRPGSDFPIPASTLHDCSRWNA